MLKHFEMIYNTHTTAFIMTITQLQYYRHLSKAEDKHWRLQK